MAVLVGILVAGAIQAQNPGRSTDLDNATAPAGGASIPSSPISGTLARPGASAEPKIPITGTEASATHLWDQAIALPTSKSLGLVGSEQAFDVEIWNTYRRTQWSLSAATVTGVGGLQLSGVTLPARLAPLDPRSSRPPCPKRGPHRSPTRPHSRWPRIAPAAPSCSRRRLR